MKKTIILSIITALFPLAARSEAVLQEFEVRAKKFEKSRMNLSPQIGASSYSFNQDDIEALPQGQNSSFNQVLLRAPNVTQDSYGQIHVRGDHSNTQYRINNVIIPESIGGFGQTLDTRFVESFDLITGAMPAQYGGKTGAVIDIKTKSGAFEKGGRTEFMTGSHDTALAAQEISGSQDGLNYYVNGSLLKNNRGVDVPTATRDASNNDTRQGRFFGYFSKFLDDNTKLTFMASSAVNRFELPNNPDGVAAYDLANASNVSPIGLNQRHKEENHYAILALNAAYDKIDYQLSAFVRDSSVDYDSDFVGDLVFSGVASDVDRGSLATGLQGDLSYELNKKNILRTGFVFQNERINNKARNAVFELDNAGAQASTNPVIIHDNYRQEAQNYGIYAQNEYKATKKLTINYGLRYDAINSYINEDQLSPRLGAFYDLSKNTQIHFAYAKYFTAPSNELVSPNSVALYASTSNEGEVAQNDMVKSERTNYYDVGIKHKLQNGLNLGLDAFYKDIKNLMDRKQSGETLLYTPFNFARGRIYGLEFTSDFKKGGFEAFFNAAWQRAMASDINTGQYLHEADEIEYLQNNYGNLDHEQQITASAGASYKVGGNLYSADALYGGGLRHGFANSNKLPAYFVANAAYQREFNTDLIGKAKLRFSVLNLFDQNYKIRDGSGIAFNSAQFGLRRSYYLTAIKEF